jgi:hypothetical protein
LIGAGVVGVVTLLTLRRTRDTDVVFASTTLASLLVSPLGWVYYLWLVFPGALGRWRQHTPRVAVAGLALLMIPLVILWWFQPSGLATMTLGSVYSWGTLSLWIASVAL